MDCFRQIYRLVRSRLTPTKHRVLEIGPPTNFRKEETPRFFTEDDTITLHSGTAHDKHAIVNTAEEKPSKRDKIKNRVRKLSVKMPRPLIDAE
ncbi:hypothetical protein BDW62DRAFT_41113 [Aspergillus aurantiobrunneus]